MQKNNDATVTQWFAAVFAFLFQNLRQKLNLIRTMVERNSLAIMSACNPEIMEDILDTDGSNKSR